MPQKSWAVGEEVLAADFNSYLQNQVVAQFTSAAARTAQWTAPPEGALSYLSDVDRYDKYEGGWRPLLNAVPRLKAVTGNYGPGTVTLNDQIALYAGSAVVTTNGAGDVVLAYPTAFTTAVITVIVNGGDALSDPQTLWVPHTIALTSFQARAILSSTGGARAGLGPVRINYIALGV